MVTCPWCGTSYPAFVSNCRNCGGPLPVPVDEAETTLDNLPVPPPPPRSISRSYTWRLLAADGWAISALVFGILGAIFTPLGAALTLGIVTAFVGIPFVGLGLLFLAGAAGVGYWRYQEADQQAGILRLGEATEGQITQVEENLHVEINGHHPWTIRYQYRLDGLTYAGQVSTLSAPGPQLAPGQRARVLYLPQSPQRSVLYPHP